MLPLRDDHGRVSRMMGVLVMSGRRGLGGRRFTISDTTSIRFEPTVGLHAIQGDHAPNTRPSLHVVEDADTKKAKGTPALRLVVSNS